MVKGKSADQLMTIFIDIVKTNSVTEYGAFYLQNYTYYAYQVKYLVSTQNHHEPGYSNVAPNTAGGKQFPMYIP